MRHPTSSLCRSELTGNVAKASRQDRQRRLCYLWLWKWSGKWWGVFVGEGGIKTGQFKCLPRGFALCDTISLAVHGFSLYAWNQTQARQCSLILPMQPIYHEIYSVWMRNNCGIQGYVIVKPNWYQPKHMLTISMCLYLAWKTHQSIFIH